MKRNWDTKELEEHFTILPSERHLVMGKKTNDLRWFRSGSGETSNHSKRLDGEELATAQQKILNAGVEAILKLDLTRNELEQSKEEALRVAWTEMANVTERMSIWPTWEELPTTEKAYQEALRSLPS